MTKDLNLEEQSTWNYLVLKSGGTMADQFMLDLTNPPLIEGVYKEEIASCKQARSLLTNRDAWCQGSFAEYDDGASCSANSKEAAKWCLEGARIKFRHHLSGDDFGYPILVTIADHLFGALIRTMNCTDVIIGPVEVNDTLGYEAAMTLLDTAIAYMEGHIVWDGRAFVSTRPPLLITPAHIPLALLVDVGIEDSEHALA